MITSWQSTDGSTARIQARSNFSLDAWGLIGLLSALGAVTLVLAGLLAWQGYWPVLLIAAFQVVLVTWILVRAWERAWLVEVIEVRSDMVVVTQHRYGRKRQTELESAWAVVETEPPTVAWYRPRIFLRSGSESVELGGFLTGAEKHQLASQLQSAIKKHSAM